MGILNRFRSPLNQLNGFIKILTIDHYKRFIADFCLYNNPKSRMFYEHDILDIEIDQQDIKHSSTAKNIIQNYSIKFLNLMKRANTVVSLELADDLITD